MPSAWLGVCKERAPTFMAAKCSMEQKTMETMGSMRPGGTPPTKGQAAAPGAWK